MTCTSRRFAASAALLLLLGVACSDDKEGARSFSSSTPSTGGSPSAGASSGDGSTGASASGSASTAASAGATASTSAGPTATPLHSAGTDPALQGGPTALPPQRAYTPPDEGLYTYANTGENKVSRCAVDNRPPPPTTNIQVSAVRGARQEAVRGDAEQGSQATVVEYRNKGIYLVSLVIDQPGLGRIEFRPTQAVLLLPDPATKGQEWKFSATSTDNKYTVVSTNQVLGLAQPVRLGDGTRVSTTLVRSVTKLKGTSPIGAVDLTITTLSSASSKPALAVKEVADTDGTVGPCTIEGHIESLMHSVRPG